MKYQTINAGDHFGRLETLERIKIGRRIAWICKCSCGNTRAVLSQNLNNGTTKSCGCYNREAAEKVGIDAIMDTTTGMYMTNTLTVALTGDTRSSISQITIYVADSMYTLNTVIYNGGVTYYSLEMLNDTTVTDYFDRRNGQTVDIQLIDQ